jgi:hypothetical protein
MKTIQVPNRVDGRMLPARVYRKGNGLAVTRLLPPDGRKLDYRITHLSSGKAFGAFETVREATEAFERVLPLADWTLPEARLVTPELGRRVMETLRA